MDRFTEQRRADAPIEDCWDVLVSPDDAPRWAPFVSRASASGDPGVSRRLTVTGSLLGMTMDVEQTVDVWDAPTAYGWRMASPFPVRLRVELVEVDPATTDVEATLEVALDRLPVGRRIAGATIRRQIARSADNLVALVEGRTP
ncbi:SRPBCC family protein [Egicoccus halophilus]|uniref:Polyketide cyclase / dehydrase and lipid transport n=1 Tax=Egicoccus halophilus TaxID=1670830 RepID=A0A8J3ES23_9ACTN|nr:SRPBCC family protein [Egicoccus halophilus]GGI06312.1 hypothetical protein GCM10011354_18460 [Egicoccus halophilus]